MGVQISQCAVMRTGITFNVATADRPRLEERVKDCNMPHTSICCLTKRTHVRASYNIASSRTLTLTSVHSGRAAMTGVKPATHAQPALCGRRNG